MDVRRIWRQRLDVREYVAGLVMGLRRPSDANGQLRQRRGEDEVEPRRNQPVEQALTDPRGQRSAKDDEDDGDGRHDVASRGRRDLGRGISGRRRAYAWYSASAS